jgi:two-component system OmpR family response regulator
VEKVIDAAASPETNARFLLIDDDDLIRSMLADMLRAQGHEVFTAAAGRQGLRVFKDRNPDLVVTDLTLPDLSGLEVASAVKAADAQVPVVLITGGGTNLIEQDIHKNGVDFILRKPFQLPEVEKILNEMVRNRSKSQTKSTRRA